MIDIRNWALVIQFYSDGKPGEEKPDGGKLDDEKPGDGRTGQFFFYLNLDITDVHHMLYKYTYKLSCCYGLMENVPLAPSVDFFIKCSYHQRVIRVGQNLKTQDQISF